MKCAHAVVSKYISYISQIPLHAAVWAYQAPLAVHDHDFGVKLQGRQVQAAIGVQHERFWHALHEEFLEDPGCSKQQVVFMIGIVALPMLACWSRGQHVKRTHSLKSSEATSWALKFRNKPKRLPYSIWSQKQRLGVLLSSSK